MSKVTTEMVRVFCDTYIIPAAGTRSTLRGLQALFDANLISLPVDADKIREDVVREAMALFECLPNHHYSGPSIHADLQSLLPTKDRAEELAEEYYTEKMGGGPLSEAIQPLTNFARWLIAKEG